MTKPIVVIPTYNERDNVGPLAGEILALPEGFEVLFVDDDSPDGTGAVIELLQRGEGKGRVHLLRRPAKLGLGSAYRDGFAWAIERAYDPICQMDADFSHDPKMLSGFVASLEGCDVVLGSRYIPGGALVGWPLHRRALSRFANVYARLVTRAPIDDLTGGFKAYRRVILKNLLDAMKAEGYAFQIQTTVAAHRRGYSIREVPIRFKDRTRGKSKLSRRVVLEAFASVLRLARWRG